MDTGDIIMYCSRLRSGNIHWNVYKHCHTKWGKELATVSFSAIRRSTNCSWDQNPSWSSQVCISLGQWSKLRLHQTSRCVDGDHITTPFEVIVIPACPSIFTPWPTALEKNWSCCMYGHMCTNNAPQATYHGFVF